MLAARLPFVQRSASQGENELSSTQSVDNDIVQPVDDHEDELPPSLPENDDSVQLADNEEVSQAWLRQRIVNDTMEHGLTLIELESWEENAIAALKEGIERKIKEWEKEVENVRRLHLLLANDSSVAPNGTTKLKVIGLAMRIIGL